jgi:hypothetical protein
MGRLALALALVFSVASGAGATPMGSLLRGSSVATPTT